MGPVSSPSENLVVSKSGTPKSAGIGSAKR
jgi:hypothetical protein